MRLGDKQKKRNERELLLPAHLLALQWHFMLWLGFTRVRILEDICGLAVRCSRFFHMACTFIVENVNFCWWFYSGRYNGCTYPGPCSPDSDTMMYESSEVSRSGSNDWYVKASNGPVQLLPAGFSTNFSCHIRVSLRNWFWLHIAFGVHHEDCHND